MKAGLGILFVLLISVGSCWGLYEDQVGKFDWSAKHVGCFQQTLFGRTESGADILLAATGKNAIAQINVNTGDIVWRQINEESTEHHPEFKIRRSTIVAMLNNGEYFRAFDQDSGTLKWQHRLGIKSTKSTKFAVSKKLVAVMSGSKGFGLEGGEKITTTWAVDLDEDTKWLDIVIGENGDYVFIVGILKSEEVRVARIDAKTGALEKLNRLSIKTAGLLDANSCIVVGGSLICSTSKSIFAVDIATATQLKAIDDSVGANIDGLKALQHPNVFIVQTAKRSQVCEIAGNSVKVLINIADRTQVYAISESDKGGGESSQLLFAAYYEKKKVASIFDLRTGQLVVELKMNTSPGQAPIETLQFIGSTSTGSYQLLVIRKDCRVDFYEAQSVTTSSTVEAELEWVRLEGLASISSVEMIDMPLSEAQAGIESEFGASDESAWKSFFIRITSQAEQVRRSFASLGNRLTESLEMFTSRRATLTTVLRHLIGYDDRRPRRDRTATILINAKASSAAISEDTKLERDYFNLRKLIVVTTLTGSVYALNNDDGEVIWSLYLGEDAIPFKNQLGHDKIPLFIQRGTTHFQYSSQAAVVFNVKGTRKSTILFFNPVTGVALPKTAQVEDLKRVELMPFADPEMLHCLLTLDTNGRLRFYPDLPSNYKAPRPVHLLLVDTKTGSLRGAQVDFEKKTLAETWNSALGFLDMENIVAIAGKPLNQKVHSQGKVLGDRSVLYKYANPNLVAISSVDEKESTLRISMVDAVTGQVVYMARHPRSLPPVHMVHCENWLVYTYWNEKARRNELGIVELYEGLEQTNEKHFNSYTTLKSPLNVFAQSYVFSQGVSAMATSETEQGLSTRSLIIAMPFGGVLEISRRFVDARRPLELTPEMREEMIIPYMPEIPIATEDLINYNQSVHNIVGIKTSSSGLESTSLVFVYGLDIFYTRVTPSGSFDILKEDFDYLLIALVMVVLIVASVVCKRICRYNSLKQAWS